MEESFYSEKELVGLGLKKYGIDVLISKKASIYDAGNIIIGNHVRIDDFCVLSGKVTLGDYIHIAVYSALFGGAEGIEMKDFSGLSARCILYAGSDDYSGNALTNPMLPREYRGVYEDRVIIGRHAIVGAGTTILPGVELGEGCAVGSMSLVNKSLEQWGVYAGIPCRYIKARSRKLLELEAKFLEGKLE